jgi:hypothetical protein
MNEPDREVQAGTAFVRFQRQGLELLVWAIVEIHTNSPYLHADDL